MKFVRHGKKFKVKDKKLDGIRNPIHFANSKQSQEPIRSFHSLKLPTTSAEEVAAHPSTFQ